jgi:hypothetical protein
MQLKNLFPSNNLSELVTFQVSNQTILSKERVIPVEALQGFYTHDGLESTLKISSLKFGAITMLGIFSGYIMQSHLDKMKKFCFNGLRSSL